jgi:hypothetical protein
MVSVKLMRAMPAAAGHISSASFASGSVSFGNPPGISPTTLTPIACKPMNADAAVPRPIAMRGAGARLKNFSKTMMTANVAIATNSVVVFVSGSFSKMCHTSRKKPSLWILIPTSLGNWSTTITSPMPALKPVSTGSEMKFARKPSLKIRATSRIAPTRIASVAVATTGSADDPPIAAPPRIAMVVVVLTDSTLDVPSTA